MIFKIYKYLLFIITICFGYLYGQHLISSNPSEIIFYEKIKFLNQNYNKSLTIRPLYIINNENIFSISIYSDFFINDNRPNLENMGNKWVGKGLGSFTGINLFYANKYIIMNIEPYYYNSQNEDVNETNRYPAYSFEAPNIFNVLNDNRYFKNEPYRDIGFRESSIFLHHKKFGIGISNSNMWWGPGLHSSLTMTNNTTGFPHLMIGTINEKIIGKIGINLRYYFSQLKKIKGSPYFSALTFSSRIFSKPTITFGLTRNYLSGGLPTDREFSMLDAALLPFESLFIDQKIKNYPTGWDAHDNWDQTMSGYITIEDFDSGLIFFIELGTDDHRQNLMDLRSQPDHTMASIIGIRKYGIFNDDSFFAGFEYANIKYTYTHKFRGIGSWWWRDFYEYSTYDGRRWAAHSGSDSDDFYFYFGYDNNSWSFTPGFNYERHGIITGNPPEQKFEFRLDLKFSYKKYRFKIYYERELLNNFEFIPGKLYRANVLWFRIEKDFLI